ncbi:MAG: hypothetical protein J6A59_17065, partial [Lachnospiraceae bacterium]|nr:hypothetical protein [Lachnospiraceae bacterium]
DMANTKRRSEYIDRNGNMFMPMNVEGGVWNEHFITTPKLICIVLIVLSIFIIFTYLQSNGSGLGGYLICVGTWALISINVLRFIVFEEKFYYKMYLELKDHEISSPALFWDIASIKDTDDGAIVTYSDARIGIMVKVERDTITGKTKEFRETHYDAISDFYREVATNRYSFVQMNIMEQAGKDPRLTELSKVVYKSDNDNICKLMEMQVGHIKNITRSSLYESDYFLFYTPDLSKVDTIIQDISECIFKLLDGAYISYKVLNSKDIVDFVKEEYGVNYFNSTDASLQMFDRASANVIAPFTVKGILWTDGENQELTSKEINNLRSITSSVIRETKEQKDISLKSTLYRKNTKNKIGVDFSQLSEGHTSNKRRAVAKPKATNNTVNKAPNQPINTVNINKVDEEEYIDL